MGAIGLVSAIMYFYISRSAAGLDSEFLKIDARSWLMGAVLSFSLCLSFVIGFALRATPFPHLAPFVDPLVLMVASLCLLPFPVVTLWRAGQDILQIAPGSGRSRPQGGQDRRGEASVSATSHPHVARIGRQQFVQIGFVSSSDSTAKSFQELDGIRQEISDARRRRTRVVAHGRLHGGQTLALRESRARAAATGKLPAFSRVYDPEWPQDVAAGYVAVAIQRQRKQGPVRKGAPCVPTSPNAGYRQQRCSGRLPPDFSPGYAMRRMVAAMFSGPLHPDTTLLTEGDASRPRNNVFGLNVWPTPSSSPAACSAQCWSQRSHLAPPAKISPRNPPAKSSSPYDAHSWRMAGDCGTWGETIRTGKAFFPWLVACSVLVTASMRGGRRRQGKMEPRSAETGAGGENVSLGEGCGVLSFEVKAGPGKELLRGGAGIAPRRYTRGALALCDIS